MLVKGFLLPFGQNNGYRLKKGLYKNTPIDVDVFQMCHTIITQL